MIAYVINVDDAKSRWNTVEKECNKAGLQIQRVRGVLAKLLSVKEKLKVTSKFCARFCPHAYIGISMSHLHAWEIALMNNKPALICEDDVEFVDGFQEKVKSCMNVLPSDWDILYVGCLFCEGKLNSFAKLGLSLFTRKNPKAREINNYVIIPDYAFGTHAYMVSVKGMRKLISYFQTIDNIVDVKLHELAIKGRISVYSCKNMLARQTVSVNASSISSSLPRSLKHFDGIQIAPDVTLRYGLSYPHMRIGNQNINSWSFIFLCLGILFGRTSNILLTTVFLCVLFAYDVGDVQLFGALCFFLTGFLVGRAFTKLKIGIRR